MAHGGTKSGDEAIVTGGDQTLGREIRQSPALPYRVVDVRWRADGKAAQHFVRRAPGMAAGRIHAHRHVSDYSDGHGRGAATRLRCRDALLSFPLQKQLE